MKSIIHRTAAIIAFLSILSFFLSSIFIEIFGTPETIAIVKSSIVFPGLFILIAAIAITGATGFAMAKNSKSKIILGKKSRMPFIALNGILILLPAAIFLDIWATSGLFDTRFYIVQAIELIAGAINLSLMGMNIKDGRKMTGKNR